MGWQMKLMKLLVQIAWNPDDFQEHFGFQGHWCGQEHRRFQEQCCCGQGDVTALVAACCVDGCGRWTCLPWMGVVITSLMMLL